MYASSTQAAGYIARRERLGIFQAKPVVAHRPPPPPEPPKRVRDFLNIAKPVVERVPTAEKLGWAETLREPRWREITREVCATHGVTFIDLCSPRRDKKTSEARAEACWRMRHETTLSLPQIGKRLGGRDHTTIIYNIRRFEAKLNGETYHKPYYGVITANIEGEKE